MPPPNLINVTAHRVECPRCGVSYPFPRLGITHVEVDQQVTVRCLACQADSDVRISVRDTITPAEPLPWWQFWAKTPDPTITTSIVVTTQLR